MNARKFWLLACVAAAIALVILVRLPEFSRPLADTSAGNRSVFYRLVASYQYGQERVDFDIVVGCAVRVTSHGDGGSSYDALRHPVVYAQPLRDGGALMQIVPDACRGETTDNGRVPDDFLPGAVWFERADDLSLGIAYVTEDAFESPRSKLKFLGATIRSATQEDWEAFRPTAEKNLIDPRPLFTLVPAPPVEAVIKALGDSKALARLWPGMSCHVITRIELSREDVRTAIREHWPASRPRYWMPTEQQLSVIEKAVNLFGDADGDPATRYLSMGHHVGNGFPTRARGGMLGSVHKEWDLRPPTLFPLRKDEGFPWITPSALTDPILFRDVELSDAARGFAYCYRSLRVEKIRDDSAGPVDFLTRVNGEAVHGEDTDARQTWTRPWPFFERDQYLYYSDRFGLN